MGDIIDDLTHEQLLRLDDRMCEARQKRFRDEPLSDMLGRIDSYYPKKITENGPPMRLPVGPGKVCYAEGLQSIYEVDRKAKSFAVKSGRYEMVSVSDVLGNKVMINLEAPPAGRAGYYTADDLRTIARTLIGIADFL